MGMAFKVAGNSYIRNGGKYTSSTTTAKQDPQRYYQVSGIWPRYEVMILGHDETRQIIWGERKLKAHLVSLRMQGYIDHKEYWK